MTELPLLWADNMWLRLCNQSATSTYTVIYEIAFARGIGLSPTGHAGHKARLGVALLSELEKPKLLLANYTRRNYD